MLFPEFLVNKVLPRQPQLRPQQPRLVPLHPHRRPHLRPPHQLHHPRVNQEQGEEGDPPMPVGSSSKVNPERIILHFKIWTSNEDLEEKESLKNRRFI